MILSTELEQKGNQFPSKIVSYKKDVDTLYFTTENYVVLQVTVMRDSVIRFRYSTKTIEKTATNNSSRGERRLSCEKRVAWCVIGVDFKVKGLNWRIWGGSRKIQEIG